MSNGARDSIDPRAWLLWWLAASLPALAGRNPFLLLYTFVAVLTVWFSVRAGMSSAVSGNRLIQLGATIVTIGVVFNVLTVHAGDVVLFTIPEAAPLIGGEITLNAVVYGVLGGLAILILVVAGVTVAGSLEWSTVMRLLPDALVSAGVAGSIAFTFFPQALSSFRDIREARFVRGAQLRTVRDYASVASPVLESGLERAVTLSELLEVRAFGTPAGAGAGRRAGGVAMAVLLTALCVAAYLFAAGRPTGSAAALGVAVAAAIVIGRTGSHPARRRTQYRPAQWGRDERLMSSGALLAVAGVVAALIWAPETVRYEPYPALTWPAVSLQLLLAQTGLFVPAFLSIAGEGERR